MRRLAFLLTAMLVAFPSFAEDLENGEEVYEVCAACHGPYGQGGGGGIYPRLAGMDSEYLADQMEAFKSRERENIPMLPYATERELPDEDVEDVAAYLMGIELAKHLPPVDAPMDALERLNQAKKVLNIPLEPGDQANGKNFYDTSCARCHGEKGEGSARGPLLAGQHIKYLKTQIERFVAGQRKHMKTQRDFVERPARDITGLWAYLSTLDD
ncbi:MAG: c-type cytochrome [Rhodospirillaceae bacterium]|nr:c-type cytochrome [Rhodospirillaceae bacterium]